MLASKESCRFAAMLVSILAFSATYSPTLLADSPADSVKLVSAFGKKARGGCPPRCPTCQKLRMCEPTARPPVVCPPTQSGMQGDFPLQAIPTEPYQPPAPYDSSLAPPTAIAPVPGIGIAPQDGSLPDTSFNLNDAQPAPQVAPDATDLFAANRSSGSRGAFGSSLLGATTPEMMGDFFGPGGVPSVFTRFSNTFTTPVPSAGYALGRMKLAENNSPNPRDRIFFNYSLFTGVPLATDPITVNRFSPGFEKTFFDGMASVELRAPFGTSLDTDILANGLNSNTEFQFGNMFLSLKGVLAQRDNWLLTAGSSILLPTASDTRIIDPASGAEFLRIENDSTHLMPFLGGAFTPNSCFFAQWILQADIDLNGNRVIGTTGTTETQIGTLQDSTLLYTDIAFGYWVYKAPKCCGKRITGIAPIVELHYNRALTNGDSVADANNSVFQTIPDFDNLNTQFGLIVNLRNRTRLGFGYATPLGNRTDRVFDNELRITLNRYF